MATVTRRWILAIVAVAACDTDTGPATRARVDSASTEHCLHGGIAIHSGFDGDNDKAISDDEISATTYLCKPEEPPLACERGSILRGPVTIRTPEDQEDLEDVTCIEGDLLIVNTDDFEVLGLGHLTRVTGHVAVAGNPNMTSLDSIEHLREVGRTYLIQGNDALADLSGLRRLVRADLAIYANDHLPDLAGMTEITTAPGSITIAGNAELASLHGLEQLTTADRLVLRSNPNLADVTALANLRSLGALDVTDNTALARLELPALGSVAGELSIKDNGRLSTLGLPALQSIGGTARFANNRELIAIRMPGLQSLGALAVAEHRALAAFNAPALGATGHVRISGTPALRILELSGLGMVAGAFSLEDTALDTLVGLASLQGVGGKLTIESSSALADFTGLGALAWVQALTIKDNSALVGLDGLDGLTAIGGDLTITGNAKLPPKAVKDFVKRVAIDGAISIE